MVHNSQPLKAVLLLEDGTFYEGKAAGASGEATGEICFNTGMTGYQEVFTDPSYFGQIMLTTNAHIGNYGIAEKDSQSEKVQIAGLVCKNFTNEYSRLKADSDIQSYFEKEGIVGIYDVDTRSLVRHIRDKGAMNCIISTIDFDTNSLKVKLSKVPSMEGLELASKVSTNATYEYGNQNEEFKVAVLDFGTKKNILDCFVERNCSLKVFPAKSGVSEIRAFNPDGYFLSNGPGDPSAMAYAVDTVKELLKDDKPMFGICLGHQILALANDIPTYKMHHGHRGINHPVINVLTGKCEITSQNHGFGVSPEAVNDNLDKIEITHKNLNDGTIEGIRVKGKNAFSVQYHPESSPGPHDSRYLFDEFIQLLRKR
jgi:carbamoyl-phosphate synthase small subunit